MDALPQSHPCKVHNLEFSLYHLFILFRLSFELAKPFMLLFPADIDAMRIALLQQTAGRVCEGQHLLAWYVLKHLIRTVEAIPASISGNKL